MSYRIQKIESMLLQEISSIILFKLNDPAFGFITVTNVRVSPDLKIAKIYISVMEKEKREPTLAKIKDTQSIIRSELAHRIKLRFTPELKFFLDESLDYVEKVESLLRKIHEDDNKKES